MSGYPVPTICDVENFPQDSVLCVLDTCAKSAERILLSQHPDDVSVRDLMQDEPLDPPAALPLACLQLLARIGELRHALVLYHVALRAQPVTRWTTDQDIPF